MLAKYKVEYGVKFHGHTQQQTHLTNDPVECEQFLSELLEHGFTIGTVSHDGAELPRHQADGMIKNSIGLLASRHLCTSLGIDTAEAHHRFGSPA